MALISKRAIFLDKDGTLIENLPYNVEPSQVRFSYGAAEALRLLDAAGYLLVIVSNQSGVARGYFSEQALGPVEQRLRDLFGEAGVPFGGFYYCPHHPAGTVPDYALRCGCRKPEPGLILRAACDWDIDCRRSWLIGDILDDVEAGHRAGCSTVLVDNGNETEWRLGMGREPDHRAANLIDAAQIITGAEVSR